MLPSLRPLSGARSSAGVAVARRWRWLIGSGVVAVLVVVFVAVGLRAAHAAVEVPAAPGSTMVHRVVVRPGMHLRRIGDLLKAQGVIRSSLVFDLWSIYEGEGRRLQAGTYSLGPGMSVQQVLQMIDHGRVATVRLVIPEGWDAAQIAAAVAQSGLGSSTAFLAAADDPAMIATMGLDLPAGAVRYEAEGYLFPATYTFKVGETPAAIAQTMLRAFVTNAWSPTIQSQVQAEGLSMLQAVTLASIVQREVTSASQMQVVAGVYLHRLQIGMALDADPTVLYGLGLTALSGSLDDAQLASDSPYNTYAHTGLPPGPICSPGVQALEAVADPTPTQALYFLSTPSGQLILANTYAEQQANQKKYLGD